MKITGTSSRRRAFMLIAAFPAFVSCALPFVRHSSLAASDARADESPLDSAAPVIQVREYPHSARVLIVAWKSDENAYGLRASLRRDGALIRDHRLYVDPFYGAVNISNPNVWYAPRGVVQTVSPAGQLLKSAGTSRDPYHCFYGSSCSPYETREVRVPDELLRANRDSLAVRFYGRDGKELIITLHRDLIDPYLKTVDSVAAELRKT
ncbi:MAG: hypothetical protein ABR585_11085 [Gemmatimonadaceae bacterium]